MIGKIKLSNNISIKEFIDIRRWSLLETMFVLYLIVSGWSLGPIPVYLWWAVLMDIVAYKRHRFNPKRMPKQYRVLFLFIMAHQFLWVFIISGLTTTYFNAWFSIVITMGSVFFIAPVLNYEKLKAPIVFVSFISIIGLLYQILSLSLGSPIGQLAIPPFASSREFSNQDLLSSIRPSGFSAEPAAYCEFMLIPFFISLVDRKYVASFVIMVSMLLSTSTTGVVLSFLMLGVYAITQKISLKWKALVFVGAISVGISLAKSELFEATMNKMESTELSENERTSIGFTLLPQLEFEEVLFGIPYANISDMFNAGRLKVDSFTFSDESGKTIVFLPTFWNMLFIFGIFGLLLYLNVYANLFRKSRLMLPYSVIIIAKMFSDPTTVGAVHLFEICFMMSFVRWNLNNKQLKELENKIQN